MVSLRVLVLAAWSNVPAVVQPLNVRSFSVEINGQVMNVQADEELVAITGDTLKFKAAVLNDGRQSVDYINLVGFTQPDQPKSIDDRQKVIRTDRDLDKAWSENQEGRLYKIKIGSKGQISQEFRLRLIEPELRYISMTINGRKQVFRPGEIARVKAKDVFKVDQIATNIENDTNLVDYRLKEISGAGIDGFRLFEIQFYRHSKLFARIPLQIENE